MKSQTLLRIMTLYTIAILVLSNTSTVNAVAIATENPMSGAYVDKVVYTEIADESLRVLELQGGDIDAILDPISPGYVSALESDPDTAVHSIVEDYFRYVGINCGKYPLNISGFRRAFAYAFDKTQVVSEVFDGNAIVHDSLIPIKDTWCIEEGLPWHYYSNQSTLGNQILDALNFTIDGGSGYRLAPDGSPFEIVVSYWWYDDSAAEIVGKTMETLASLHIDTRPQSMEIQELYPMLNLHYDYDMVVFKEYNRGNYLDWILDNFHSQYLWISYMNPSNYANDTFDDLYDAVINADTHEEAFDAVSEIQKHLHENVPVLVVCQEIDYQAYRTSEFTGHVEDEYLGILGPWTNLIVHNKVGDVFGGVFEIASRNYPNSFNLFLSNLDIELAIMDSLYSGLLKMGPDRETYLDLAEDVLIETMATNPAVPAGQAWITLDIRNDAVWSDGEPLDAEDIAFTFRYIKESFVFGNPMGIAGWVAGFISSEALSPSRARIVLDGNTYHRIQEMLLTKIIPEHIFNDDTGIGYDGWNDWNPVIDPAEPHVTCGPFYVSDHSFTTVELSRNLDYHWLSGFAPKILSVNDITYVLGTTGNEIVWEVTDDDPLDYTIFQDGSQLVTDDWNGSNVVQNVDGLSVGTFNFTLVLTDISGHIVTNTVWVIVTIVTSGGELPDILVIGTIVGSTAVILIAGVAIFKKRRY